MSIKSIMSLKCDTCPNERPAEGASARHLRWRAFTFHGWKRVKSGRSMADICPDCQKAKSP